MSDEKEIDITVKQLKSKKAIFALLHTNSTYPTPLKDINLIVGQKQKIVVCGPSGSGKSTLIRCINRLEEHQQGKITVDGVELTENTENPIADARPVTKPIVECFSLSLIDIIKIPTDAMNIAIHTFNEISSFRNKKPNSAVIKGIAAKHIKVIAAVVCVIDQINVIIAVANPSPPITPEIPIFL